MKHSERGLGGDSVALAEELRKESELEASIEAEFEAIRSSGADAHAVPTHCGEDLCQFWNPNLFSFRCRFRFGT